jgi:zinc/manganese transport system substrate-binding protein
MKLLLLVLLAIAAMPAAAALKVFATVPEWGALAREIGGDRVQVFTATTALQDAHHVDARPSLIATGADLEVGWLPVVQRESGNPRIQSGQPGYFEAAQHVRLLDVPARLDRADGDVHAAGNPHIQTDPRNILKIGEALRQRMKQIDPANAAAYRQPPGVRSAERWRTPDGNAGRRPVRRSRAIPWSSPSTRPGPISSTGWACARSARAGTQAGRRADSLAHLSLVRDQAANSRPRMVIRAAYNSARPAEWLSRRRPGCRHRGPPVYGRRSTPEAADLTALFDTTVQRLLKGLGT